MSSITGFYVLFWRRVDIFLEYEAEIFVVVEADGLGNLVDAAIAVEECCCGLDAPRGQETPVCRARDFFEFP